MDVDGDEGSRGSKRKRGDGEEEYEDGQLEDMKRKRGNGDDEYDDGEDELEDEEDEQDRQIPTHRRAAGTKKNRRRKPVQTDEVHVHPCNRCNRLGKECTKQQHGDACLPCAKGKSKCGWGVDEDAPVRRKNVPGRPVPPTAPVRTAPAPRPMASSPPAPRPAPRQRIRPTSPQQDDSESEPVRKVVHRRRKDAPRGTGPAARDPAPKDKGKGKGKC